MPKLYTYYLVIGATTTELTTDPMGWQEHSIALSRSEDFGLNIEHVVPLSFSKEGRTLIKAEYDSSGLFANVNILIKKRNNDWTISNFYEYRLDFNTYNDTLKFIEITGIETGLLSSVMDYRDTEYDIALPTSGKTLMTYTGVTINKKNLIQCSYGETIAMPTQDWFSPKGTRSIKTYNNQISFLDANGIPWESMMFQILENGDYAIRVKLNLKIKTQLVFGGFTPPASKPMYLLQHNAAMSGFVAGDILHTFAVSSTETNTFLSRRIDTFSGYDVSATYALTTAKPYISLVYPQDNAAFIGVAEVSDSFDTFMEVANDVSSQYQKSTLEYVTHEWLIKQLLNKIYPSNTLTYSLTHTNYLPALISDDCIRNLGKLNGTGKFTVKLSDVLKSLDILENIGIDITGAVMRISTRASLYSAIKYKTVQANDISLKADISQVFNKITVGWDTKKNDKEADLVYPFNCKKVFEIPNSSVENELNLIHPFIGDCYAIEKHFDNIFSQETNSNKNDVCVLAIKNKLTIRLNTDSDYEYTTATTYVENPDPDFYEVYLRSTDDFAIPEPKIIFNFNPRAENIIESKNNLLRYVAAISSLHSFSFIIKFQGDGLSSRATFNRTSDFSAWTTFSESSYAETADIFVYQFSGTVSMLIDDSMIIAGTLIVDYPTIPSEGTDVVSLIDCILNVNDGTNLSIYKDHNLSNFSGSQTVFNVPITPKRILNKHLAYISVSAVGSTDDIEFVSTELDSAITSECDFEAAPVAENADVTPITPMFLPSILSFETQESLESLTTVQSNKYKYIQIEDEKTGDVYSGWINNITFAVGKNKSQRWELQSK